MIRWRTKLPFCQFVYLCSIAAFLMSKSVLTKLYICCLCRSAVFYLSCSPVPEVLRTVWWHAPMLLSNGSLGCCPPQAWHRESKVPCPPAPLPPAWSYEESTGWHDENKVIITETPNVTVLDTNDWPLLYYDFIETCSCNGHFYFWKKKQCNWNGSDRACDWSYQESTSCHMRKKICEFVGLFEAFRPVIFIGTLCIF